jgi:hypothetical protein
MRSPAGLPTGWTRPPRDLPAVTAFGLLPLTTEHRGECGSHTLAEAGDAGSPVGAARTGMAAFAWPGSRRWQRVWDCRPPRASMAGPRPCVPSSAPRAKLRPACQAPPRVPSSAPRAKLRPACQAPPCVARRALGTVAQGRSCRRLSRANGPAARYPSRSRLAVGADGPLTIAPALPVLPVLPVRAAVQWPCQRHERPPGTAGTATPGQPLTNPPPGCRRRQMPGAASGTRPKSAPGRPRSGKRFASWSCAARLLCCSGCCSGFRSVALRPRRSVLESHQSVKHRLRVMCIASQRHHQKIGNIDWLTVYFLPISLCGHMTHSSGTPLPAVAHLGSAPPGRNTGRPMHAAE